MLKQSETASRLSDYRLRMAFSHIKHPKVAPCNQGRLLIPDLYQGMLFTDPNNLHLDFTKPVACSIKSEKGV